MWKDVHEFHENPECPLRVDESVQVSQRDPLSPSLSLLSISLSISPSLSLSVEAGFVSSPYAFFLAGIIVHLHSIFPLSPERTILDYGDDSVFLIKEDRLDSFHMSRSPSVIGHLPLPLAPCFLSP